MNILKGFLTFDPTSLFLFFLQSFPAPILICYRGDAKGVNTALYKVISQDIFATLHRGQGHESVQWVPVERNSLNAVIAPKSEAQLEPR